MAYRSKTLAAVSVFMLASGGPALAQNTATTTTHFVGEPMSWSFSRPAAADRKPPHRFWPQGRLPGQ